LDVQVLQDVTLEPVTLVEVKSHLRVTFADDDTYIEGILIPACRAAMEKYCGVSLATKILKVQLVNAEGNIELPYGPVQQLVALEDSKGNAISDYLSAGLLFKRLLTQSCDYTTATYIAGYIPGGIPPDLKLDLLRIIGYCYEHRGDEALSTLQGGMDRAQGLGQALELFAKKHKRVWL
jgi:uncharacterized phiE125 gp8 family phage protein